MFGIIVIDGLFICVDVECKLKLVIIMGEIDLIL